VEEFTCLGKSHVVIGSYAGGGIGFKKVWDAGSWCDGVGPNVTMSVLRDELKAVYGQRRGQIEHELETDQLDGSERERRQGSLWRIKALLHLCRVKLCVVTSNLCPGDSSGGPGGSDRKHPRDDGDTAAAAAAGMLPIWKNATWAVARAIYGDDTVDGAFPDDWLTEDNFAGCTHWMLGSAMLSFKCLYTGADGANLYELKALRCVETGQGTAETLLRHWQHPMVFGDHHRKKAV
jgi:hypothetical protein